MDINDFTRDLTAEVKSGLISSPIGRDEEIKEILNIISQKGKSNALLLGEAGVGKTAIVEGLATALLLNSDADFPKKKLIELNLTALNSGAKYVGEFEERVTGFINKCKQDNTIVVFIDEIHMLMGFGKAGDGGAARDLSQIIKPELARGEICVVGATTTDEFEQYISKDQAFTRRFAIVSIKELSAESVFSILKQRAAKTKYESRISIEDNTLRSIVKIAPQILPQRKEPDRSLDLLSSLIRTVGSNSGKKRQVEYTPQECLNHIKQQIDLIDRADWNKLKKSALTWIGSTGTVLESINLSESELLESLSVRKK